jgi:hypothetical protein
MKFKSNIEVQAGLEDASGSPGTVNQLLSSTVTGTAWIDPSTIVAEAASLVIIACKNTSGAAIPKGTPVYQTGNVGATATIEIAPADALISANKLPAIGVLQTDLNNNGFGNVVITGELTNFTTSPIDGVVPTTGDKIFVKSGGGLTLTKPTGEGNGIQNMGLVGKVSSGNSGSITVSSIMRTNDVPNLPEGRIWIGDGNTIVSDTVYVDEPNNRVGIGTTSPNSKLDIIQTTDGSGVRIYGYDDRSTEYLRISDNGSSGVYGATDNVKLESGGTGYVFLDSNNDIFFDVGSSGFNFRFRDGAGNELMRIEGGGNVGIGTTSPGEKLEVAGNIELNSGALIISGTPAGQGAQTRYISGAATTNDLWLNVPTNGRYRFAVADSQKVEITADGNVGIGTTNPSNPLHVYSSDNILATFESTDAISEIRIKDSSKYTRLLTVGSDFKIMPNDGVEMAVFEGDTGRTLFNAGNVGIGTTSPSEKLHVSGGGSGNIRLDSGGTYYGTNVQAISSTGLKIGNDDFSGYAYFHNDGNVGIGTTTPQADFVVSHQDTSGIEIEANFQMGVNNILSFDRTAGALAYETMRLAAGDFWFTVLGIERMRIDSTGNVGIGTTSPSYKLTSYSSGDEFAIVAGAGNAVGEFTGIGLSGYIATNAAVKAGLVFERETSWGIGKMHFLNNNTLGDSDATLSDSKMTIDATGNVGIGTTNPSAFGKFVVSGSGNLLNLNATSGKVYQAFYENGAGRFYLNTLDGSDGLAFTDADGATERMRIDSAGNVGIGTTSPTEKLVVDGKVIINNTTPPNNLAQLNIGSTSGGETRAIDIDGNWTAGESKSITFAYGTDATHMVGQINCVFNTSTDSRLRWGKLYHGGVSSTYTMELKSTSTTTANLTVAGSINVNTNGLINFEQNTDIDTGAEVVAQVAHATYTAAFFDFVIKKGTNVRSGTVYACHDGTNVEFTETSTNDLGDTSDVTLSVDISGANMRLLATVTSDDWSVKSLIRAI